MAHVRLKDCSASRVSRISHLLLLIQRHQDCMIYLITSQVYLTTRNESSKVMHRPAYSESPSPAREQELNFSGRFLINSNKLFLYGLLNTCFCLASSRDNKSPEQSAILVSFKTPYLRLKAEKRHVQFQKSQFSGSPFTIHTVGKKRTLRIIALQE